MNHESIARSLITVDEVYTYNIEIANSSRTTCTDREGTISVRIPYDGLVLRDISPQQEPLALGEITIGPAATAQQRTIPITLPADALAERVKRGEHALWRGTYTPDVPIDPLIAIDGQIFDGADFDPEQQPEQLYDLLFGTTDTFVNDLRLQLNLWVPNLFEQDFLSSQAQELRAMLIEQESNTQVLVPDLANAEQLARHMAALANTGGGRILLGVRSNGVVVGLAPGELGDQLIKHLLSAALACTPALPIFAPVLFQDSGKQVVRLVVAGSPERHAVGGIFYRREAGSTVVDGQVATPPAVRHEWSVANLTEILGTGNTRDVAIIDAHGATPDRLDLGMYIVGFINAGARNGMLVIRNLPEAGRSFGINRVFGRGGGMLNTLEARLKGEAALMTPQGLSFRTELTTIDREQIAVVRIAEPLPVVAMYEGSGYIWASGTLRVLSAPELLERYLQRTGTDELRSSAGSGVKLEYGELQWPVQPPSQLKIRSAAETNTLTPTTYQVQRGAIVWQPTTFTPQAGTNGLQCQLTTRLRQAFVPVNGQTDVMLTGQIRITFDNALASGFDVRASPAAFSQEPHNAAVKLFARPQIKRQTTLLLNLSIAADWLFQRRRRMSLLHFRLPDITFAQERLERLADLRQACADLGFWVYTTAVAENGELQPYVILKGIRSTRFRDLHLLTGIRYEPSQIDRELRYTQRTDIKKVQSGRLDTRILLWSAASKAESITSQFTSQNNWAGQDTAVDEPTMTQLQLELRELIEQRLHYLRSE